MKYTRNIIYTQGKIIHFEVHLSMILALNPKITDSKLTIPKRI